MEHKKKKREKWDAEWQRIFDSRGQDSDSEKPRVISVAVPRSEVRVNGIVVSNSAVKQAHLDGVGEAAGMCDGTIRCQDPVNCGEPDKQAIGDGSMEEQMVLAVPGQKEVVTSGSYAGAVLRSDCSAGCSSSEIARTVQDEVSVRSGMTTVDCELEESLLEEADGDVFFRLEEINQDHMVGMEKATCDDADGFSGGCQDVVEMEGESQDTTQACSRCEGIYKLNGDLMRERCGGIFENACEQTSLEEVVTEELIFFSDNKDETDEEISDGALDGSRTKNLGSRNVSPVGVSGGSELAEKDEGERVGVREVSYSIQERTQRGPPGLV